MHRAIAGHNLGQLSVQLQGSSSEKNREESQTLGILKAFTKVCFSTQQIFETCSVTRNPQQRRLSLLDLLAMKCSSVQIPTVAKPSILTALKPSASTSIVTLNAVLGLDLSGRQIMKNVAQTPFVESLSTLWTIATVTSLGPIHHAVHGIIKY